MIGEINMPSIFLIKIKDVLPRVAEGSTAFFFSLVSAINPVLYPIYPGRQTADRKIVFNGLMWLDLG